MEIIKIGKDSFKISLDKNEMKKYELEAGNTNENEQTTYIKKLLNKAKSDVGVDFGDDKMTAEVYVSKDGGCEIFVSRLRSKGKDTRAQRVKHIYRFSSINDLFSVCFRLKAISYKGHCEVYHNKETKSYYLIMEAMGLKDIKYSFICEYAERVKHNMLPYIIEYCDCVCVNKTVEIFSKLL